MGSDKKVSVTCNTTRIVEDRLAKVAATYTNGYVRVLYVGDRIATDVRGTIFLPAALQDVDPNEEPIAWSHTCHEMGHQGVENDLQRLRKMRKKVVASAALAALVPPELHKLRDRLCAPGIRITEKNVVSAIFGTEDVKNIGEEIVRAFSADDVDELTDDFLRESIAAAKQFMTLVNVIEDVRMEKQVANKWPGSESYLESGNDIVHRVWYH